MDTLLSDFIPDFDLFSFLTKEEMEYSRNFFKRTKLKKGDFLSKEGDICKKIAIVRSGILRSFYNKDDEQLTTYFNIEGTIATALRSYLKEVPAYENMQAVTDVEIFYIEKKDMNKLFEDIPAWNKIVRIAMETLYVKMEERSISLQYNTAKERYLNFLVEFPNLANRIPLQYIASFLGITPETLSRIRKSLLT
ncbi:MAG: Crp/Fnr family transcriptional regulator [Bacteroidota bacterium]